jgi:hypothetical protein
MPPSERITKAIEVQAVGDAAARVNAWQRSQGAETVDDLNAMAWENVDAIDRLQR